MKLITRKTSPRSKSFYGHKIEDVSTKSISSDADNKELINSDKGITKIELVKSPDGRQDALVFTRVVGQKTSVEIKELDTSRNDELFEIDAKLIKTYELLSIKRDVKRIIPKDFLCDVKDKFLSDVRNAYKIINTSFNQKEGISVYIYHIYALLIATMSIINEIDFKPPVLIELKKLKNAIKLSMKIKSIKLAEIKSRQRLIEIPGIEMRLEYIGALCREDDINSTLEIHGNTLSVDYIIEEIPHREGIVFADAYEEKHMFNELMDAFSYTREVQAEEE